MTPPAQKKFGAEVRKMRERMGIGLREFARRTDLSPSYISQMESGVARNPGEAKIEAIAHVLNRDTDELLALANRSASDLQHIIEKHPREYSEILRQTKKWNRDDLVELLDLIREKNLNRKKPRRVQMIRSYRSE